MITDQTKEDIRARVDLVDLVGERVRLKKMGKNFFGICPFHEEKSPSFSVDSEKQFYYCFGCGAGGDCFDWLQEMDGLEFPDAVKRLADSVGVEVATERLGADEKKLFAQVYGALEKALQIYQENLSTGKMPEVSNVIRSRGISPESIQKFQLGAALNQWNDIAQQFGGYKSARLLSEAGLAVYQPKTETTKAKLYDRMRNGLVFPIHNERGAVVSFARRKLDGEDGAKYLNGPETIVFNKKHVLYGLHQALQANQNPERFIVTEGYIDVIMSHQHGFPETVATMGTSISEEAARKLFRHSDTIVFAFDGDKAGVTAAIRALENVLPVTTASNNTRFVFLPAGEDPDSMVRKYGADVYREYLDKKSIPLTEFLIRCCRQRADLETKEGRARFFDFAVGYLNKMPPSSIKTLLTQQVSDLSGIRPREVLPLSMDILPNVDLHRVADKVAKVVAEEAGMPSGKVRVEFMPPKIAASNGKVIESFVGMDVPQEYRARAADVIRVLQMKTQVIPGYTLENLHLKACQAPGEAGAMAKAVLADYTTNNTAFEAQTYQMLTNLQAVVECVEHLREQGAATDESLRGMNEWLDRVKDRVPAYAVLSNYCNSEHVAQRVRSTCDSISHFCHRVQEEWRMILGEKAVEAVAKQEINEGQQQRQIQPSR